MASLPGVPGSPIMAAEYLRKMADGTVKQINPFTGTEVWTVPGRANRPVGVVTGKPVRLSEDDRNARCAFCVDRYLETPPEKARSLYRDGRYVRSYRLTPDAVLSETADFRRIPNLFEIIAYSYWHDNYGQPLPTDAREHMRSYLESEQGRDHVLNLMRVRLPAEERERLTREEQLQASSAFFGSGHDVIVARRHFVDHAEYDNQIASSGSLTPVEHAEYIDFTVDALADLYRQNRYVRYVAVFQNWLRPAGASFDHLHKQLVAIDERGIHNELEIRAVRANPNIFNEAAVDYAGYHNLVVAENQHAIAFAGFGHRYPSLEIYSKSEVGEPWLMPADARRDMSDLIHAMHAATGADVACNEEWHYKSPDVDVTIPWHVVLKWRVSTVAGFEGGTKIYLNTIDPYGLRDKVVSALFQLRADGKVGVDMRIAQECLCAPNSLRYNPNLRRG